VLQRRSHLDDDQQHDHHYHTGTHHEHNHQHHDLHDNVDHHLVKHDDNYAGTQYDDVESASVDIHEHQHDNRTDFHDAAAQHHVHQYLNFDKHVDVNLDQHQYVDQYDHQHKHQHQHKHHHDDACTDDDHLQPAAMDLDNHHGCSDDHDESGTGNNFDQHLDEFHIVHIVHIVHIDDYQHHGCASNDIDQQFVEQYQHDDQTTHDHINIHQHDQHLEHDDCSTSNNDNSRRLDWS
jgi:hypothetical protein